MSYLARKKNVIFIFLSVCISYNLYFLFLLPGADNEYLAYLDFLLAVFGLLACGADYRKDRKRRRKKEEFLKLPGVIFSEFPDMDDYEIAEHDVSKLKEELDRQYDASCDLQDYIAKWCHEVKAPLSASLLMNEKIEDEKLRFEMREQLERVSGLLKSVLLGCRIQSPLFDMQVRKVRLSDCVNTAIRNNRFFLIRNHFQIEADAGDFSVYSDKGWLVYVLDQIIGNAVKYKGDGANAPVLKVWAGQEGANVALFLEDRGEGIEESDLRRIFDKGYIGKNRHNGQYKSTGMGLYMAARICEKLGHEISVESEKGKYSRFSIRF